MESAGSSSSRKFENGRDSGELGIDSQDDRQTSDILGNAKDSLTMLDKHNVHEPDRSTIEKGYGSLRQNESETSSKLD